MDDDTQGPPDDWCHDVDRLLDAGADPDRAYALADRRHGVDGD